CRWPRLDCTTLPADAGCQFFIRDVAARPSWLTLPIPRGAINWDVSTTGLSSPPRQSRPMDNGRESPPPEAASAGSNWSFTASKIAASTIEASGSRCRCRLNATNTQETDRRGGARAAELSRRRETGLVPQAVAPFSARGLLLVIVRPSKSLSE